MRFLKRKIERVGALKLHREKNEAATNTSEGTLSCVLRSKLKPAISKISKSEMKVDPILSTKNIVKNYGRAICNFAASQPAIEYMVDFIGKNQEKASLQEFVEYVKENKESIDTIERLQKTLLITPEDDELCASIKRIFQHIGIIFIKYFSVNWVYSGRLTYKLQHLKFQSKMLRRVKHPELFTYLKPASRRRGKNQK